MSKATPTEVRNMGFDGSQFGDSDGSGFVAYLQQVLDDAAEIVEARVTSAVYTAATSGITFVRISRAERFLAAADLWRRREAYENSTLTISNDDERASGESRNMKNADKYEALAEVQLSKITGDDSDSTSASGIASGALETGNYPLADA